MKKWIATIFSVLWILSLVGCGTSVNTNGIPDPEKIVPSREILIENLKNSGYEIETKATVSGADFIVDRIVARKGDRSINIVYGLSDEEANAVFTLYEELYPDDYYILAHNGSYVYFVSDKKTFRKAGFTTTANIGVQYMND